MSAPRYIAFDALERDHIIELTEPEYLKTLLTVKTLLSLWEVESLFSLFAEAMKDFESRILRFGIDDLFGGPTENEDFYSLQDSLNLRVLAVLTAARAYHDHRPQRLGGSVLPNGMAEEVEALFSAKFDSSFEYRLVEALRNYAQHNKLPISGTQLIHRNEYPRDRFTEGAPSRGRKILAPYIEKAKLLLGREKLRAATMRELEEQDGEKLDARYFLRNYASSVTECHLEFRSITEDCFLAARDWIDEIRSRVTGVSERDPAKSKFIHVSIDGEEETYADRQIAENLTAARKRWRRLAALKRLYISSQLASYRDVSFGTNSRIWIPE